jgi:ring-1,2-phenylacetyl-CoA epoxidase subunit PaaE
MAPVFSLLKKALSEEPLRRVVLISQQHDKESILFRKQLEGLLEHYPGRFRWINILSTPGVLYGGAIGEEERAGRSFYGRLTNLLLEDLLEELSGERPEEKEEEWQKKLFYLCGPPAFMRMVQFTLRLMGVGDAQIRKENFTVEFVPPPPPLTDNSPKQVTIRHAGQTTVFDIVYPTNLLQAALDHGVVLPYSCRGGRCSSCTVKCLNGQVKMSINDVLTDKDLQEGLVLTCVGYAATDVELRY